MGADRLETVPSGRDWADLFLRWAIAGIVATGLATLVLLMLGVMRPWIAWPVGLAGALVLAKGLPDGAGRPVDRMAGLGVALICLAVAAFGWAAPHEHLLGGRDAGTYVATGAWAASTGSLVIPSGVEVLGDPNLVYESRGFAASPNGGRLYPQFMHLFPGLIGLAAATASAPAMLWVNPLLAAVALLALFCFARRMLSDRLAALVCLVTALVLPFTYFSRAQFSEPLAMLLVFGGLWAMGEAVDRRSTRLATGAGVLLGGVFLARLDGLLVVLALAAYLTWLEMVGAEEKVALIRRTWLAATVMAVLALVDGLVFSPVYIANHGGFIAGAMMGVLVVRLLGAVLRGRSGATWLETSRGRLSNWVAGSVGIWLAYAWALRPLVESPIKSDVYGIEGIQAAAGVAVEPLRSYAELSVRWLVWYLGAAVVAAGLLGMVLLLRRLIKTPGHGTDVFTVVAVTATLTYLYRPSINPDHIWATRRFLPVIIPGLILLAVWLVARWASEREGRLWTAVFSGAVVLAMVPVGIPTVAVGYQAELSGAMEATQAACAELGPGSVVLFIGGAAGAAGSLMPILRGLCGAVTAAESAEHPLTSEALAELASRVESEGRVLWVISGDTLGPNPPAGAVILFDHTFRYLEGTLFSPPREWEDLVVQVGAMRYSG